MRPQARPGQSRRLCSVGHSGAGPEFPLHYRCVTGTLPLHSGAGPEFPDAVVCDPCALPPSLLNCPPALGNSPIVGELVPQHGPVAATKKGAW